MGSTGRTSGNGAIYVNQGFSGHRIKTPKDGKQSIRKAETHMVSLPLLSPPPSASLRSDYRCRSVLYGTQRGDTLAHCRPSTGRGVGQRNSERKVGSRGQGGAKVEGHLFGCASLRRVLECAPVRCSGSIPCASRPIAAVAPLLYARARYPSPSV